MVAASLCCLIPVTIYSALEDGIDWGGALTAGPKVEPTVLGGTVVSITTLPASSRRNSFNSIAMSLIVW